ncbi:aminopeptidase N [Yinghuangia sp. ASG 101]|uniref:aminopeptidase N n=1 Tax=Yinghuangia sp. ASG 101 TaxID=2896848 RepID=UPI001E53965D|nr:aminopeptidase N [Yinghuangia sp. ASG 101]UGQ09755.1 aminopeptidase N [Yinghuangia sp. ASG 101]
MPGTNLTRDEARERARILTVDGYDIALDLTSTGPTFASETTVRFSCAEPGASTFIDLIAPSVTAITLNGVALDPAKAYADSRIRLDDLAAENELRVVAACAYMNTGEGLHRFVDPVDGSTYLYTQFEVADARRVFANFEQPDLKGTFTFTITAPADWEVIGNAPTPTPVPAPGHDGASLWRFAPTPRISTYITALVAGHYHAVRDTYTAADGTEVPLGVFCRRSLAEYLDADHIFAVTRQGFDYFLEQFDFPYPFAKYDQLFVPEYNAGAMENAGCVTILEDYVFRSKVTDASYEVRAETILHELAHMWFGDLVTMQWWDDLWLNESFATYASILCQAEVTRWKHAWATFGNRMKTWAYRQDQLPSTHPIFADIRDLEDVEVNFDGITYAKGASVLKQLVAYVGADHFMAGVRTYFKRHAWGNTTLADLLTALEETSGRDLSAWSDEWLRTAGINTVRPEITVDADGTITSFAVLQEAPEAWPTIRTHRMAIGFYHRTPQGLARSHRVELDVSGPRTEVAELVGRARPDVVLLNDDDLTYCKIRLDPHSLAVVTEAIGEFVEPLPRALCWAAAWDMTRDAEMAARDYLTLVLSGIGEEKDINIVGSLHRQLTSALELYADPAWRPTGLARLAEAALGHLRAAAPGSDHQLAWARCLAGVAVTDDQIALLKGLLAGTETIDGLAVDTDLRWTLLRRLVAVGAADRPEIDAERARDDTAAGARHAAACLAARPTREAKDEAWASVVESDALPNATQASVIGGFVQTDQRELLAGFTDRYFAAITEVWENRTNEIAQQIVLGLYPSIQVSQDTLDRTDAWLADAAPPPALRRLVVESRDGVARALRAQRKDSASA